MEYSCHPSQKFLPPAVVVEQAIEAANSPNREQGYQALANLYVSGTGVFGTRLGDIVGKEFVRLFLENPELAGAWQALSSEFLPHKLQPRHLLISEHERLSCWEANYYGALASITITFNPTGNISLCLKHKEEDSSILLWKVEQGIINPAYEGASSAVIANLSRENGGFCFLNIALHADGEGAATLCSLFRRICDSSRPSSEMDTWHWEEKLYPLELGSHTLALSLQK